MAYPRFNPEDRDPDIGLLNGNRSIILITENAQGGIRANVALAATDKIYCEYVVDEAESDGRFGLATAGADLAQQLGYDEYGWGFSNRVDMAWHNNVETLDGGSPNTTDGTVIRIAFDAPNGNLWFGRESAWLGTGADPAAGTNPAYSGLPSSGMFLAASLAQPLGFAAAAGTLRTDPATFTHPIPTGFSAPSYAAPTLNAILTDCSISHRIDAIATAEIIIFKPTRGGARLVLPTAGVAAHGGGQADGALPTARVIARGHVGINGRGHLVLPTATAAALGWQPIAGQSHLTVPAARMTARGFAGIAGQARLTLPAAILQATGYMAAIGGGHLVLPHPICCAQGTVRGRFEDFTLKHRRF